jgi:hypothetical protein
VNLKEAAPPRTARMPLTADDVASFREHGFLHIAGFYDLATDIDPILDDIRRLIAMISEQRGLGLEAAGAGRDDFDLPLVTMVRDHRASVGVLYDAVKKIQSYVSLACDQRHADLAATLLGTPFPGFANRGYGIRMDHPDEDRYLTQLHQDYVSQMCSPKGIVLWSPLRDVTEELGPVEFFPGSHREGILPIRKLGTASQDYLIVDEASLLARYPAVRPLPRIGDLVVADFLLLHRSCPNRSGRTRWAMLSRYFDFLDPTGRRNGWHGGIQEGRSFSESHPDLCQEA